MTEVWRCGMCEAINTDGATCAVCGASNTMAVSVERSPAVRPPLDRPPSTRRRKGVTTTARVADRVKMAARRAPSAIVAARATHRERLERERSEHATIDDDERPRVRVLPVPGGCLFSLSPRRRRR